MSHRKHPNQTETIYTVKDAVNEFVRPGNFHPAAKPAIYWGPDQYSQETGERVYSPPEAWRRNEFLRVPKVFRFIYEEPETDPTDGDDDDDDDPTECKSCQELGITDYSGTWAEYVELPTYHAYVVGEPGTPGAEKNLIGGNRYLIVPVDGEIANPDEWQHVAYVPSPPAELSDYWYFIRSENDPPYEGYFKNTWKVLDTTQSAGIGLSYLEVFRGSHLACIMFLGGRDQSYTIHFWRRTIRWCTEEIWPWGKTASTQQMQVFLGNPTYDDAEPTDPPFEILKQAGRSGPARDWPEGPLDILWPDIPPYLGLFSPFERLTWGPPVPEDWLPNFARTYSCPKDSEGGDDEPD